MVKNLIEKGTKKGRDLFGSKQETIISAAFVMMVLLVLTKLAGFVKLHFFARIFGASAELDVFWAAFTFPDIIFNIIVLGTINAALIPLFAEKLTKGEKGRAAMQRLFSDVLQLFLMVSIVAGIIVFIFAPQISRLIASGGLGGFGFESGNFTTQDVEKITTLMRIMIISPVLLAVSSVLTASLQVNKRFIVPALAPLFYNIGIIIGAIVFAEMFDLGVVGLAFGVVLGSTLHLLIQIPLTKVLGFRFLPRTNFFDKDVIRMIRLALPRVFGLMGEQISLLVNTFISMGLGAGALSAFRFASSIYILPVQLFGGTIAQAALPTLSLEYQEDATDGQMGMKFKDAERGKPRLRGLEKFRQTFIRTMQQILFLILPAVVFIMVLRLPVVRLVLGAGAFDWEDTVVTSWVLAMFAIAIVMQSIAALVIRAFFAMQETVIPVVVSLISVAINIVLAFYLTNFFSHYYDWRPLVQSFLNGAREVSGQIGVDVMSWLTTRNDSPAAVGGLAVSAGIAIAVEVILLMVILNRRIKVLSWKEFWQPALKKLFAAWVMFVVMYSLYKWWNFRVDTSTVVSIVGLVFVVGGIGAALYFGVSAIIDVVEVKFLAHIVKKAIERVKAFFRNGNASHAKV